MVLNDKHIKHRCLHEGMVQPFIEANVQPASIDLRLGNKFRVFQRDHDAVLDMRDPVDITREVECYEEYGGFTLHPGEFVLGHTLEKVNIPVDLVARIEGKSSLGRLGLAVHITAGYIDPGFMGSITLEIACEHPLAIRLYPGQLICQLSFHKMIEPPQFSYKGRYQGDESVQASRFGE